MEFLTEQPIDIPLLLAAVQSPARGGVAMFLGTVRNHQAGQEVLRLRYSAYQQMAEAECARIVAEAQAKWDVAVSLAHRLGQLEIGDIAVAVVAAAAHREEAFAACRYLIEQIKRRVPIWKQEFYADGSVGWVNPAGGSEHTDPGPRLQHA
jgi:molybdopterin synthase catalytic subunit